MTRSTLSMSRRRRRSSKLDGGDMLALLAFLAVVVFIVGALALSFLAPLRHQTVTIHAYGKENGKSGQRVYTTDGDGIYTVKDSTLNGHFDSGTTYARLPVPLGALDPAKTVTLTCEVAGFRIPLFSEFKNILSCTPGSE